MFVLLGAELTSVVAGASPPPDPQKLRHRVVGSSQPQWVWQTEKLGRELPLATQQARGIAA